MTDTAGRREAAIEAAAKYGALESELRQILAQLELCSHVSAAQAGTSSRDASEGIGGKRPPGGSEEHLRKDATAEERADFEQFALKSVDHFRRRLARAHSQKTLEAILAEAEASLEAWRKQPPPGIEPEFGTSQWKRWIGESTEGYGTLANRFGCHRSYIQQIKKLYRIEVV